MKVSVKSVGHGNNDKTISDNVSGDTKSDEQHGGHVARTAKQGKQRKKASMAGANKESAASNVEQMFKKVTYKAKSIVEMWKRDGRRFKVTISFFPLDGKEEVHVALASWRDKQEEWNDGWGTESGIGVGTVDEAYEDLRQKLFDTFEEYVI